MTKNGSSPQTMRKEEEEEHNAPSKFCKTISSGIKRETDRQKPPVSHKATKMKTITSDE